MGNMEKRKAVSQQLKEKLNELLAFKLEDLKPESEEVILKVIDISEALEEIQEKSSEIINSNIEVASVPKITTALKSAISNIAALNEISDFEIPSDLNQISIQWDSLVAQLIV
ncbi:MAG: hypothetical protein V3S64_10345, partial [bacterium]